MFSHERLFLILSVLLFCSIAPAQEAYKFDDVTRFNCDVYEVFQLRNLRSEIAEKAAKGALVVYGKKGEVIRYAEYAKENFFTGRGIPSQNLSIHYGGFSRTYKMEVWVVPKGAKEPRLASVDTNNKKDPVEFDWYSFGSSECPDDRMPALVMFSKELKQNPNSVGYVVVYYARDRPAEHTTSPPRKGHRASSNDKIFLIKSGISASRIFTVDVGYDKNFYAERAELWVVPSGAKPPKLTLQQSEN